jgi:hypothetical protein
MKCSEPHCSSRRTSPTVTKENARNICTKLPGSAQTDPHSQKSGRGSQALGMPHGSRWRTRESRSKLRRRSSEKGVCRGASRPRASSLRARDSKRARVNTAKQTLTNTMPSLRDTCVPLSSATALSALPPGRDTRCLSQLTTKLALDATLVSEGSLPVTSELQHHRRGTERRGVYGRNRVAAAKSLWMLLSAQSPCSASDHHPTASYSS